HTITASISDGQTTVTVPRTVFIGGGGGGGGDATFAVDQSSTGIWKLYRGSTVAAQFYYGNPSDYPFMGDWNGDGIDTPGLYRRSDGYVYLRNSNTHGIADIPFFVCNPG